MLIRIEPFPTILLHPLQSPARNHSLKQVEYPASSHLSILSRVGIEIILSQRGERYFSPLACLSSALNPFLPRASDESAKSAYRADRNYRARPRDSFVEAISVESRVRVVRCTLRIVSVRVRVLQPGWSPRPAPRLARLHGGERAQTAGNYRSSVLLPWRGRRQGCIFYGEA